MGIREFGIHEMISVLRIRRNSKEDRERVFDPFFSTRVDGSGLGLAISYQIVHEHRGFIDLESEVGKGTSFRVNLPLNAGRKGVPGD